MHRHTRSTSSRDNEQTIADSIGDRIQGHFLNATKLVLCYTFTQGALHLEHLDQLLATSWAIKSRPRLDWTESCPSLTSPSQYQTLD